MIRMSLIQERNIGYCLELIENETCTICWKDGEVINTATEWIYVTEAGEATYDPDDIDGFVNARDELRYNLLRPLMEAITKARKAYGLNPEDDDMIEVATALDDGWEEFAAPGEAFDSDNALVALIYGADIFGAYYPDVQAAIADLDNYFAQH